MLIPDGIAISGIAGADNAFDPTYETMPDQVVADWRTGGSVGVGFADDRCAIAV